MDIFRPKKGPFPALSPETEAKLMDFYAAFGQGATIISADGQTLIDPTRWRLSEDGSEVHVFNYPTTWLCGRHVSADLMEYRRVSYQHCEVCKEVTLHHAIEQQLDPLTRDELLRRLGLGG